MTRRTFDSAYKVEVASMILDQKLSIAHVNQTIEIGYTSLGKTTEH